MTEQEIKRVLALAEIALYKAYFNQLSADAAKSAWKAVSEACNKLSLEGIKDE